MTRSIRNRHLCLALFRTVILRTCQSFFFLEMLPVLVITAMCLFFQEILPVLSMTVRDLPTTGIAWQSSKKYFRPFRVACRDRRPRDDRNRKYSMEFTLFLRFLHWFTIFYRDFFAQTRLKQIWINKNLNRERQNRLQCLINIERKRCHITLPPFQCMHMSADMWFQ